MKFTKGERIRLSEYAIAMRLVDPQYFTRLGTVQGHGRRNNSVVWVIWDGTITKRSYHLDFLRASTGDRQRNTQVKPELSPEAKKELERCDQEIVHLKVIGSKLKHPPAWLCALGEADWLAEKHLILLAALDAGERDGFDSGVSAK